MMDKDILKQFTPRVIGPQVIGPTQRRIVQLNVTVNMPPDFIPQLVKELVLNGKLTPREAVDYLEALIDNAQDVIRELTKQ
jgi:polyhydroxyalkanoate synthesis regulator phasin